MASIRSLHSPDIHDLPSWTPPDPRDVGLLLQILAGPADSPGEESFDLVTLRWLEVRSPDGSAVFTVDPELLGRFIDATTETRLSASVGES